MPETVELQALVSDASLIGISTLEVSARRPANQQSPAPEAEGETADEGATLQITPTFSLTIDTRKDDGGFRFRLRVEIDLNRGTAAVEVAAEYQYAHFKHSELPKGVIEGFVNGVAVMALVPYARQHVADATLRVFGTPVTMPMFRQGELAFSFPREAATEA